MGSSIEAHVAFGWIMPEHDCAWKPGHTDCTFDAEYDCWDCENEEDDFWLADHTTLLDVGYDGNSYVGEGLPVVYLNEPDTDCWTSWHARPLVLAGLPEGVEKTMRDECARLGIKAPDTAPAWIMWPHYG